MALLKTLFGWGRAKDRDVANSIEEKNIVGFATNDLEDMQKDLTNVKLNIGHIKARIGQLNDDIKEVQDKITLDTSKAEQLINSKKDGAEGVAQQLCKEVESLEQKLVMLKQGLSQQETLLTQNEATKQELEDHLQECQNELELMKTQKEVTDGNESLVKVSATSAGSAVEKFKERRKKLQEKLRVSTEMVAQSQDGSKTLSEKADQLLGTSKGSALFEKLKAKTTTPAA